MKRTAVKTFSVLLFSCLLTLSCGEREFKVDKDEIQFFTEENGFTWNLFDFNGKYGICDDEGEVLELPKYENISYDTESRRFIMEQVLEGHKFIVIKDESLMPVVPIIVRMVTYTKRTFDKKRYYYRIQSLSEDGDTLVSACDRNWTFTVCPLPENRYSVGYHYQENEYNQTYESFCLSSHLHGKWINIFMNTSLDQNGNAVKNKNISTLLYRVSSPWRPEVDLNSISYSSITFGDDYIWINPFIYYYDRELNGGIKVYRHKMKDGYSYCLVDESYDVIKPSGSLEDYLNEGGIFLRYEQLRNPEGDNYSVAIYEEYKDSLEQFKSKISKFSNPLTNIDSDDELNIRLQMHEYANKHFWE